MVLIAGAYGYGNTGDEVVLRCLVSDLRARVADLRINVLSDNPAETSAACNVESTHWQDIPQIVQAAKDCDLMLLGGGGLFYDYWGANPHTLLTFEHAEISYFTGLSLLSRLFGKRLMFYAVGVGPLLTREGRLLTRVAFEQAALITVRDPQSRTLLEEIGIESTRVRVTADPAFHIPIGAARPDWSLEALISRPLQRPLIGVALRQWNFEVEPAAWERGVAQALDSFVTQYGGTVVFLPFHRSVPGALADDQSAASRVREQMCEKEHAVQLPGEPSFEEHAAVISQCDLMLGMRLHSIIFALRSSVAFVALTYDPKVSNTLARFGLESFGIAPAHVTADRLTSLLESGYRRRSSIAAQIEGKLGELEALSRTNADMAAELLNGAPAQPAALSESALAVFNREAVKHTISNLGFNEIVDSLIAEGKKGAPATSGGQLAEGLTVSSNDLITPADLGRYIEQARLAYTPPQKRRAPPRNSVTVPRKPQVAYLAYMLLDWQTQEPRFGGGERYALTLASLLRDLGFEVTFYQAATSHFRGEYYGFPVNSIPFSESYSEFQCGLSDEFYRLTQDYDYIIYNLAEFASGEMREDALLICHGIWFDHNNYPAPTAYRTQEWFLHLYRAFKRPCKVVSVDTNSINVMRAFWPELGSQMTHIPNWVDTGEFTPPARRAAGTPTVLFPRRSQINRGSRMIGPILEHVEEDCDFLWVGEGEREETDHIKSVAERDNRLRFEAANFEDMPRVYQRADICVISTLGSEGTSLSCLEALASGCAVIATNVGGLPNLIQHEINGLLVEPDAQRIASAISRLASNPEERVAYQRKGQETARYFDISYWRKRWMDLLREMGWIT